MNKRDDALREALLRNIEETQRWQTYLKDNETAIENLSMFGKRLTVDVMVPVGKKAFMPGHLLHTNEVLVGHYQGYFSQCTSFKAKEICELRIKMAKEHLNKLETESELWQNKLEKPYAEGVMPSGNEREIIEDYSEENEKLWKEKHIIRMKEAKQKEREEREKDLQQHTEKSHNKKETVNEKSELEIFKMLEDAELMEELEQELDELEVDEVNDETIRKLMSGEMKLPDEKKRLAHDKMKEEEANKKEETQLPNIVKKIDIWKSTVPATNNNVQPNPELLSEFLNANDVQEPEEESVPEEVNIIKEQAKFLNAEDQIGFYEYQIEIIRQKIQNLPLRKQQELDEKIRLLNVLEHLEEQLEQVEEIVGAEELNEKDVELEESEPEETKRKQGDTLDVTKKAIEERKSSLTANDKQKLNEKRHISFALEDQTLEFRKNETVTQMLPHKPEKPPQRDIIKLHEDDEKEMPTNGQPSSPSSPSIDKKDLIQAKVERNLQFVSENQSKQDFDLVQQILQASMGQINTLNIKFQHSKQEMPELNANQELCEIPGSPADFYNLYIKSQESMKEKEPSTLFINSYEGEDQVKAPVLKEVDRQEAFKDPKSEFSNPSLQAKSILKNKSSVDKENHISDSQLENNNKSKKSKKKSASRQDDDGLSAYNKVMNEVVEKPPLTEPEPLPDVKFIDAHTPKKRISRFKQMRQGSEKT